LFTISVCVLSAEATVVEFDTLAGDVVAETPAAEREPVLALAGWDTFELLNVVVTNSVIRVSGENIFGAQLDTFKSATERLGEMSAQAHASVLLHDPIRHAGLG
jgi:hypothetical protein